MRFERRISQYLAMTLLLLLSAAPATAEWQGTMDTVDGVTTITNPETPAFGNVSQELRELWRRGEDEDELFFGTIAEFLHDDEDNIYLLDGQLSEIHVFDPAGELVRTIGREGEGPGEFQNGSDMFWAPGDQIGIVQAWPGKIVMITPEGDPGSSFALPFRDGGGFQSVTRGAKHGDNMLLAGTAWTREDGQQWQFTYLKSYDASGAELATFQEIKKETAFGDYEFIENDYVDFQRRWAVANDGRVAASLSFDDYRIHIWNADGTVDRIIERPDYATVKRNAAETERFQTMYDSFTRWNRGSTFRVSETHQTIGQIFFREDGTLWVQDSSARWRSGDGVFTSFDVYDQVGRFVKRVDLMADADATEDGLYFVGDRAYVVTDLYNAIMASAGAAGGGEGDMESDAEPVSVIAFAFEQIVATTE
ncbi:MAG: 6-bladed beta-propeller [Candidatus Krumholzibacteria bacterium]|nr:6-bladed beta-propeller [Candidatus Krumholzibacteria bacterium]